MKTIKNPRYFLAHGQDVVWYAMMQVNWGDTILSTQVKSHTSVIFVIEHLASNIIWKFIDEFIVVISLTNAPFVENHSLKNQILTSTWTPIRLLEEDRKKFVLLWSVKVLYQRVWIHIIEKSYENMWNSDAKVSSQFLTSCVAGSNYQLQDYHTMTLLMKIPAIKSQQKMYINFLQKGSSWICWLA